MQLKQELELVLEQINVHWFQKAKENAIYDGDHNTGYFHTSTIVRTSITALKAYKTPMVNGFRNKPHYKKW